MVFTTLKYKTAPTAILKENLRFSQLQLNYINSQKKQTEKERLRLVWLPKLMMRFMSQVYCAKERPVVENIESDVPTLKFVTTIQKRQRRRQ